MTSTSEWLPEPTIRRRLWELAKFKRTDVKLGLSVRQLIDNLVTAHIKNWYGDKIQVDSEGNRLVEWTPVLRRICRLKPDIWLAGNSVEAPAEEARRRRGPQPGTVHVLFVTCSHSIGVRSSRSLPTTSLTRAAVRMRNSSARAAMPFRSRSFTMKPGSCSYGSAV